MILPAQYIGFLAISTRTASKLFFKKISYTNKIFLINLVDYQVEFFCVKIA